MDTSPQVVIITGASAGIGAALAKIVRERGHHPVLAARTESALAALSEHLGGALFVPTDVTRREDVERLVARTIEHHGHIDVLVNNAGRGISRPVSALTDADLDDMMTLNVKSALYGMQAVLPHFKARGRGHIVNVSSMLGRVPFAPIRSAYSGAKHFLNALTTNLRMELAEAYPGIAVTLFSPGAVATDFGLNALHGGMDNRLLPNVQDVTEAATVLADALESRAPEVYSRPGYHAQVAAYYADLLSGAGPRR